MQKALPEPDENKILASDTDTRMTPSEIQPLLAPFTRSSYTETNAIEGGSIGLSLWMLITAASFPIHQQGLN